MSHGQGDHGPSWQQAYALLCPQREALIPLSFFSRGAGTEPAARTGSLDFAPTLCLCGKKQKQKQIRPQNGPEIQCLPRLEDTMWCPVAFSFQMKTLCVSEGLQSSAHQGSREWGRDTEQLQPGGCRADLGARPLSTSNRCPLAAAQQAASWRQMQHQPPLGNATGDSPAQHFRGVSWAAWARGFRPREAVDGSHPTEPAHRMSLGVDSLLVSTGGQAEQGDLGPRTPGACSWAVKVGEAHTLGRTRAPDHRRAGPTGNRLSPLSDLLGGLSSWQPWPSICAGGRLGHQA